MTIQQLIFYFFSLLAVIGGIAVVSAKNPVRAVLFLVFTFFCMAALWMLLESEFLAIVLVLVYVGAVMVLFLFVVMMLDIEAPKLREPFVRFWPLGMIVAGFMLAMMAWEVGKPFFNAQSTVLARPENYSHVKVLANLLYTQYLLPFEVAGIILLVAMIAAIGLAFRGPRSVKSQTPSQQAQVRKSDRLQIISMPAETGDNA